MNGTTLEPSLYLKRGTGHVGVGHSKHIPKSALLEQKTELFIRIIYRIYRIYLSVGGFAKFAL